MRVDFSVSVTEVNGKLIDDYAPLRNYRENDEIVDLTTRNKFNFDLNHPVEIEVQLSYDGSVNLILTDGKNIPKLINSRFAVLADSNYELITRYNENEDNIYNSDSFLSDTCLFKIYKTFAKIEYTSIQDGGNLKVGNYVFYIKYSDNDGNETNLVAESGLFPCFCGNGTKINGAYADYNSNKLIKFKVTNVDTTFDYINVYYSRYSSDLFELTSTSVFRVENRFPINNNNEVEIVITGNEVVSEITLEELNKTNRVLNSAKTETLSNNTLLLGNILELIILYEDLQDLSLRIYPRVVIDRSQTWNTYIYNNPETVNKKVGYWPKEFYRFGIVYIYYNNLKSPVFNIRGVLDVNTNTTVEPEPLYKGDIQSDENRNYITVNDDYSILDYPLHNSKGVCRIDDNSGLTWLTIKCMLFIVPPEIVERLRSQGITGYYIVRQKRIPTIIALTLIRPMAVNYNVPSLEFADVRQGETYIDNIEVVPDTTFGLKVRGVEYPSTNLALANKVVNDYRYLYGVCPDFIVRLPYYNLLFTGDPFYIEPAYPVYLSNSFIGYDDSNVVGDGINIGGKEIKYGATVNDADENEGTDNSYNLFFIDGGYRAEYVIRNEGPLYDSAVDPINAKQFKVISVKEDCPAVRLDANRQGVTDTMNEYIFRSRAGTAEDLLTFLTAFRNKSDLVGSSGNEETNDYYNHTPYVRGVYGSYLGIINHESTHYPVESTKEGDPHNGENTGEVVIGRDYINHICNIYAPGHRPINTNWFKEYLNYSGDDLDLIELSNYLKNLLQVRYTDNSAYYTISDRVDISTHNVQCYRGDCYICKFTLRLFRNFQDPTAPNNDVNVKNNYYSPLTLNQDLVWSNQDQVNRGDINAIKLGAWVTVNLLSTNNLNIRSIDDTYPGEQALTGNVRAFYPYRYIDVSGNNKIPESQFINEGFSQSTGIITSFLYQDVPYIKLYYSNRIYYSNIYVNDGYQNGLRVFNPVNYRDYNLQYGAITKLLEFKGTVVIVFEHGICITKLSPPQLLSTEFINTANLLPEIPTTITSVYGSKYSDSVIATENAIYGVDTSTKKIWKYDGQFKLISELCIDSFLLKGLLFDDKDSTVTIAIKNCKAFYNESKRDIMFTVYLKLDLSKYNITDNKLSDEIAWNLCYNEITERWSTFYSWIPLQGANINRTFISFDRECARDIVNNLSGEMKFYQHGTVRPFGDDISRVLPTWWYGKQYPFEFEFVVKNDYQFHKIFDNLEIISNKAEPESFHYEITGDCFNFAQDKKEMYFRQEATRALYSYNGSNITYDYEIMNPNTVGGDYWDFLDNVGTGLRSKTALFPLIYYNRENRPNTIEDYYIGITSPSKDYSNLAGAELVKEDDEFWIYNHAKAVNITTNGRLRGNMHYREDRWFILINPINVLYKNELYSKYATNGTYYYPPLVIGTLPEDLNGITSLTIPERLSTLYGYSSNNIDTSDWGTLKYYLNGLWVVADAHTRLEIKLKDKFIKIKIRYSGKDLALIHSILTYYYVVG